MENEEARDDKERVIVLLNETAKAFQLQVAALQEELSRATSSIAQKDIKLQDLTQHVVDLENESLEQRKTNQGLNSQLQVLQNTLAEVESQLQSADAEFEEMRATCEAKEAEFDKKSAESRTLTTQIDGLRIEIDRLNVIIHRQEKALQTKAENVPKMADACLSARDFSEKQLISLRDDALQAKSKELSLVTTANDTLRAQLDALEAEMENLQRTLTSKDMELYRSAKRIDKLERHVEKLEAAVKRADGQELAMELSTKQNTQLLQCLQAEEAKNEALRAKVDALTQDLVHVNEQTSQIRSDAAVVEIDVELKTKSLERQSQTLATSLEKLQKERERMRDELASVRAKARLEVEAIQDELVQRRSKQYELTLKLHETESLLHSSQSRKEILEEELQATQERMKDLERLYMEAKRWKEDMSSAFEGLKIEHSQLQRTHKTEAKKFDVERASLQEQLKEMERFVKAQKMEMEQREEKKKLAKEEVEKLEKKIQELETRIHGLVAEANNETKRRVGVEMELTIAHGQLSQFQAQSNDMLAGLYAKHKKLQEAKEAVQQQLQQLEYEYKREQQGNATLMLWFDTFTQPKGTLSSCWLSDADLPILVRFVQGLDRALEKLDFGSNRITDQGVKYLLQILKPMMVSMVNLQENYISPQGVRQLAAGLEEFGCIVNVHEGRVEATDEAGKSILTVDISDNKDASSLVYKPQMPKPAKIKKPKSVTKPDPLKDIYGVNLVQVLMEKSKEPVSNQGGKYQTPSTLSPRTQSLPKL
ncbi:hypothetical protein LEN26_010281 [Aphanomyces euteiches]|nr:hypothetical protein AeMF1_019711 [Aphanomyces euteiches]KAH9122339.1 hypothetical protein LEN26_010281 [Aphanomyces euteiches]KAH9192049.1 hypothetical protein AeNC1_005976 [Aphanomyces euteiches]